MPPKPISKGWKFLHQDSPEEPVSNSSLSKIKKARSEFPRTQEQKLKTLPIEANQFSTIINKYTALQQQKLEARKTKSQNGKSPGPILSNNRKSVLQKPTNSKQSFLKKTATSKTLFASNLTKAQTTKSSQKKLPQTKQTEQNTSRIISRILKQKSQLTPSNSSNQVFPRTTSDMQNYRRPSLQSQWNRQSQIGTRSRVRIQYQKFFDDADNVFIQETAMMKEDACIDYIWKTMLVMFLLLSILWLGIYSIQPYGKQCPRHATCGAFINCHEGYILDRELKICQIDPRIKESGLAIMNSVIQNMKYEYGMKECTIPPNLTQIQIYQYLEPPKHKMSDIFRALDIQSDDFGVLRVVLNKYFTDQNNQKIARFKIDYYDRIYPEEKLYSLSCTVNLFYEHHFIAFVATCIFSIIFVIWLGFFISAKLYRKKAKTIYNFLREKVMEKKQINYDHYRLQIQEKFNRNIQISEELWLLINDFRIQEKKIGSYEGIEGDNHFIVWRALDTR